MAELEAALKGGRRRKTWLERLALNTAWHIAAFAALAFVGKLPPWAEVERRFDRSRRPVVVADKSTLSDAQRLEAETKKAVLNERFRQLVNRPKGGAVNGDGPRPHDAPRRLSRLQGRS